MISHYLRSQRLIKRLQPLHPFDKLLRADLFKHLWPMWMAGAFVEAKDIIKSQPREVTLVKGAAACFIGDRIFVGKLTDDIHSSSLHELGHVVLGHRRTLLPGISSTVTLKTEIEASRWAVRHGANRAMLAGALRTYSPPGTRSWLPRVALGTWRVKRMKRSMFDIPPHLLSLGEYCMDEDDLDASIEAIEIMADFVTEVMHNSMDVLEPIPKLFPATQPLLKEIRKGAGAILGDKIYKDHVRSLKIYRERPLPDRDGGIPSRISINISEAGRNTLGVFIRAIPGFEGDIEWEVRKSEDGSGLDGGMLHVVTTDTRHKWLLDFICQVTGGLPRDVGRGVTKH